MSTDRVSVVCWFCILAACLLQSFTALASNLPHHCPELKLISLGRVTPHYTDEDYQPAIIGDVATYTCVQGHKLVGDVTRLCILNSNGVTQWAGTEPYCTVVYCDDPGTPKNAIRHGNDFQYGISVGYSCHNYTHLVGPTYIRCNDKGKWSDKPPLCRSYNMNAICPPITPLRNGHIVGGKKIGEQMWFSCKSGYTLIGPSTIKCQLNRTWTDKPPVCVKGCTKPPVIPNGHFNSSFAQVGYVVHYKCNPCYKMTSEVEVKCLPNVTWSQPHPKCERITCDSPMSTLPDKRSHQFYCNAELAFECEEGFRLVGLNKLRCMESGNWSNSMPVCEYIPPIGMCPELTPPVSGAVSYSSNDTVSIAEYTCNSGYSLVNGDVKRFCHNDGVWNGTAPSCSDGNERCPFLDAPLNGFVVITGFQPQSNATYFCNEGYVLMNGDQVQECMPTHNWSGIPASCQKMELMCASPPPLAHGKYAVTLPVNSRIDSDQLHNNVVVMGGINQSQNSTTAQPTELMFLVGSVASYSCKDGFVMTGGGPSVMCSSNGSWVGNVGNCEVLQCPQPEEHPNSFVITDSMSIGSQATYHCYHGYHPSVNTSLTITCQESGNWTSLKGKCSAVECGYPPVKDDVILKGSNFTYSTEGVLLKCKRHQHQRRQKPVLTKCLSNSSWSVQDYSCSDGACPVDTNFNVCNYTSFALIGKLRQLKRSMATVSVTRYLYQDIPKRNKNLKILLTNPDDILPATMTCCKRLSVNSTYIFAGTYLVDGRKVKPIANGCRTIYQLPADQTSSVDTTQHSFLEKCQFRIAASN